VNVPPPSSCSNQTACSLDSYAVANINCNDNGTTDNPQDDTFTFDITVSGQGSIWTGGGSSGTINSAGTMGPFEIYCGDVSFEVEANCGSASLPIMVTAPPACSTDSRCANMAAYIDENNCCQSCEGNLTINTAYSSNYTTTSPSNIALNKPTYGSSKAANTSSNSGKAVDDLSFTSFQSTVELDPWWEIDLMGNLGSLDSI